MTRPVLVVCAGIALLAAGWTVARPGTRPVPARSDAELRELDMAFYERRAARDPEGAADRAQLAGLYLQRAREGGGVVDFRRAETWARRSLERRGFRNGKAQLVLASSLLAQHRFVEARAAAETLVALDSTPPGYRALLGEIQLELGDYDAARRTYGGLAHAWRHLAVTPRLARWAELEGRVAEARYMLTAALDETRERDDLPREQVAWFYLRAADLALRTGRLDEAVRALRDGSAVAPDDARLLAARARFEAARGHWRRAIRWGERALATGPDIATLALVGDAFAELGDSASARTYWARAEAAGRENPEPFNRQWTLFLLEHDRHLMEVRAILEAEIAVRPDVYGWDQLALARSKAGEHAGALAAVAQALRLGTPDATLYSHAGVVALAAGDGARAAAWFAVARHINPLVRPAGPPHRH